MCTLFYVLRKLAGRRPAVLVVTIRVRILLHANRASDIPPWPSATIKRGLNVKEYWLCV